MGETKSPFWRTVAEYGIIVVSIWTMVAGIHFFKFPNRSAFGGATGSSMVVSEIDRWSVSDFTLTVNTPLLILGFIFLGKGFGIRTIYTGMAMSISLSLLEHACPLNRPPATEPLPELLFAILLPAVDTAILFSLGASSGDINIIVMILKKYISFNIGIVLILVDVATAASSLFIFGPETGSFSTIGLAARSLVIDDVIGNLSLCKCFNTTCDDPESICDYIINMPHRSATVYHVEGAFTHHEKTVIVITMKRSQASKLHNYIRVTEPITFMLISNSSEIIGKGLLVG